MSERYYIAYGSNLNLRQMHFRCPGARVVGTAKIHNYQLLFKGSKTGSYLTIEPKKGGEVPVAIWSVTKRDEQNLDRYEGYPDFYYKAEMTVEYRGIRTGWKRKVNAFVYIMHEDRPLGVPTQNYMMTCCHGYDDFHFDWKYLLDANAISLGRESV